MGQKGRKSTRRAAALWSSAAVLAGLMLTGCATHASDVSSSSSPSQPVPGHPVPASALHRLTVMTERAVKLNGGRTPAWVSVVVTTRGKAMTSATPGDTVPTGQGAIVYLVTMNGHFVDKTASVPPGAHLPAGTYMSMVIDAKTFQGLDYGIGSQPPPVAPASFGPVTYLKVS
jgi:hypothetical protein